MRRQIVAALICGASIVGVSAGSAFAGELNGRGKGTPLVSAGPNPPSENVGAVEVAPSRCAYSGLQDYPFGPGETQTPAGVGGAVVSAGCGGSGGGRVDKP
jgi:hypothetical protein